MKDLFKLCETEQVYAQNFIKEHSICLKQHPSTIGGGISYIFTPTGVGTIVEIQCNICGTKTDISDYDKW